MVVFGSFLSVTAHKVVFSRGIFVGKGFLDGVQKGLGLMAHVDFYGQKG